MAEYTEYQKNNPTKSTRLPIKVSEKFDELCKVRKLKPAKLLKDLIIEYLIKEKILTMDFKFND